MPRSGPFPDMLARTSVRASAVVAGALLLLAGRLWTAGWLSGHPFFAYGIDWFFKLGPGEPGAYLRELAAGIPAAALIAWGLAPRFAAAAPGLHALVRNERRITAGLAVLAAALTLGGGLWLLRNRVVTDDEYVYLFQARLLLHGRAAAPAPPGSNFLINVFVTVVDGRWFGQYPPGQPLLLAPAVALGVPRLTPVILAALNVLLTASFLRRAAGAGAALAGAALLATSPLFLLTGGTLLSHPATYFGLALAAYATLRAAGGSFRWGLAAGAGLGLTLITRPYTGVTLGAFPAAALAALAFRRSRYRALGGAALAGAAFGLFFLAMNRAVSGDPFTTGYGAVRGAGMREFGFGTIIPGVHDHTPLQGLVNAALLAVRFHFWSWGWPLALVPALFAFGSGASERGRRDRTRAVAVLAALAVAVGIVSYVPYWSIGVADTGPVKTYEILLPFAILSAIGARGWARRSGIGAPAAWGAASLLAATALFWPPQLAHLRALSAGVAEPLRMVENTVERPAVVFVDRVQPDHPRSWVYGRPDPRPDLSDPILYVRNLGREDAAFWRLHPERHPYYLGYNDGRFTVVPLAAPSTRPRP